MFTKIALRQKMRTLRSQLNSETNAALSSRICTNLQTFSALTNRTGATLGYLALPNEVNIDQVLFQWLDQGKIIGIPVIKNQDLVPCQLLDAESLETGTFGIREPKAESQRPLPLTQITAVILPGLAFDKQGNRLGYGKGFYDRFLQSFTIKPLLVAVAFSFQLLEKIPSEPHDIPVDYIVTPEKVLPVNQQP